ncbi:MAG TPA: hypothetical protein VGP82_21875, partial [Ktedonobacterales bacterium]|nr:hypothetical protein [Ktedonobacterales bacterium]
MRNSPLAGASGKGPGDERGKLLRFALVSGNIVAGICSDGHNAVARVTAGGIGSWANIQALPAALVG